MSQTGPAALLGFHKAWDGNYDAQDDCTNAKHVTCKLELAQKASAA